MWGDICRLLHLPSNDVIVKISLRDLDLLFGGPHFLNIYISETLRDSAKMHQPTFQDLNICQRMIYTIAKVTPNALDLLSQGKLNKF